MKGLRTDLALEAREIWTEGGNTGTPDGVSETNEQKRGFEVTKVRVLDERGEQVLCKPVGTYTTVELGRFLRREESAFCDGAEVLAEELRDMLGLRPEQRVLVACLGNPAITPDAVGHRVASCTIATRHLLEKMPEDFASFRSVAVLEPGVLGTTGLESAQVIRAVVDAARPDVVIAVDALASRKTSRLCRTVQLADTGIVPGSGVGNSRSALNRDALGVPVIAIGVPTVVDVVTLAADLLESAGIGEPDEAKLRGMNEEMMVTPKEIDANVSDISRLIGYGLNMALHEGLSFEDVDMFVG